MKCKKCGQQAVKNGFQKTGVQRYKCRTCNKQFQESYIYQAWKPKINGEIRSLIKEGMGINNIARHLHISATTTIRRIKWIAHSVRKPIFHFTGGTYELDEMQTYIGHKKNKCWIIYSILREGRQVVNFTIGSRSSENAEKVTSNILARNPKKIYTDKWNGYPNLIPNPIHSTRYKQTNHIERYNLNLRTNCKRLVRDSICYSRSTKMLEAILKIFFWG